MILVERPAIDTAPAEHMPMTAVVAIPVRNEEDRIAACLAALGRQAGLAPQSFGVLLFLNNCTDSTEAVVAAGCGHLPCPCRVIVCYDARATAGWARRMAMEAAADWLEDHGSGTGRALLTTDADSRVAPDWVARNLEAIATGADLVGGRVVLDPNEAALLPSALHARGRLEATYEALLTEIGARLDPEPGNPWPSHWSKSGATIAVRLDAYRQVGGMPDVPTGEDHAFVDLVRAHDLVVRHDPDIVVVTSGRLEGRATGGVADTMKMRSVTPDAPCDPRLERLDRAILRVLWRRKLRRLHRQGRTRDLRHWARPLMIPPSAASAIARIYHFGDAFARIEAASPRLAYLTLRPAQLPRWIRLARLFLTILRLRDRLPRATRRGDRPLFGPEAGPRGPRQPSMP